jgi:hypothetical protein
MTQCADAIKGFGVILKPWIVERRPGWFDPYRRLSKAAELLTRTRAAIIRVVVIHPMIRRLPRTVSF